MRDSDSEEIEKNIDELLNDNGIHDDRCLHDRTSLTVYDFSLEFLEFCRQSKVSESRRCKILSLVSRYMPSPNHTPSTTQEVMAAVGLRNFIRQNVFVQRAIGHSPKADVPIETVHRKAFAWLPKKRSML